MIEKPAIGVTGFLIRTVDGDLVFRVYNPENRRGYVDYEIAHYDLEVTIADDSASLYEDNKKSYLDYSSKVLKGKD